MTYQLQLSVNTWRKRVKESSELWNWLDGFFYPLFVPVFVISLRSIGNGDLQIGLRVRDWVQVRLFKIPDSGLLDCVLRNQYRSHSILLYWSTTGRKESAGNRQHSCFEIRKSYSYTQSRTCTPIWRSLISAFGRGLLHESTRRKHLVLKRFFALIIRSC